MPNIPEIKIGNTTYKMKDAELSDSVDDLKSALSYGTTGYFISKNRDTRTLSSGVIVSWDSVVGMYRISGNANGATNYNIFYDGQNVMPDGVVAGGKYRLIVKAKNLDDGVAGCDVYYYKDGASTRLSRIIYSTLTKSNNASVNVPADATGILVRIFVNTGASVDGWIGAELCDVEDLTLFQIENMLRDNTLNVFPNMDPNNPLKTDSHVYTSCDDIVNPCIIFVSGSDGVLSIPDFPLPTPGWLITICTPSMQQHRIQYAIGWKGHETVYRQCSNNEWSQWQYSLKNMGNLPTGTNASNFRTPGLYLINSSYEYTGLPFSGAGFLFILQFDLRWFMQIAIKLNDISTVYIQILATASISKPWTSISGGGGDTYNITNEYVYPHYSQTVNLTSTPQITGDTNQYLASTGDNTDRTADILAMLESVGVCRLGPGTFVVKNLQMPDKTTIIGSGISTKMTLGEGSDCFVVKLGSLCTIKDTAIIGSEETLTFASEIGGRHGILWEGDAQQGGDVPSRSMISGVFIYNFSGGGITCTNTGYGSTACIEVVNAYIFGCWAGINIAYWSEFSKFTNIRVNGCYIGCVNNGGNNTFVNCDFSSNKEIGMLLDNSQEQSPNNTHGSVVGCVFNHTASGGVSNSGIGIKAVGCDGNGEIFDGCQIFFSRIYIENCAGFVFSNCNFGNVNCGIEINGGGAILFTGNMHQAKPPITILDNQNVHFANCYVRTTGEVVEP